MYMKADPADYKLSSDFTSKINTGIYTLSANLTAEDYGTGKGTLESLEKFQMQVLGRKNLLPEATRKSLSILVLNFL